jgi:hypothetical protein
MVGIARPRAAPPGRSVNKPEWQDTKGLGVARTPKPRALGRGEDPSDTLMSQLKVSFVGEFGSFERLKGWISHSGVHPSIFSRFRMPPCSGGMGGRGKVFGPRLDRPLVRRRRRSCGCSSLSPERRKRRTYNEPGYAHELTFSGSRKSRFLAAECLLFCLCVLFLRFPPAFALVTQLGLWESDR